MSAKTGHGFYATIISFAVIIAVIQCVRSQQRAGEMCTYQNKIGQCKLLSHCQKAIKDFQHTNTSPQTCGFEGTEPIICCVETSVIEEPVIVTSESKSKQKCKEYSAQYDEVYTVHAKSLIPGTPDLSAKASCVQYEPVPVIVGDNKAKPKEFPHMAAIGYDDEGGHKSWLCSGVLISEQFVLTSVHCLFSRSSGQAKYIRLGDLHLGRDDDDAEPQEFNVTKIYRHPDFKPPSRYNDIGLLQLDKMVKFTAYVKPACLYTNSTFEFSKVIATDWDMFLWDNDGSLYLTKETRIILSHCECATRYKNYLRLLKDGILDKTQICIDRQNNKELCMGNNGPLVSYNNEEYCMYNVLGIQSFGASCDHPDVFTRVSAYVPWIEGIVWPS